MDERTFQQGMSYLAAAYGVEVTKERAAVYWDQLGSLRDEPFLAAVNAVVGSERRFPTVAQLRECYRAELRRLSGAGARRLASIGPGDRERGKRALREMRRRTR